MSPDPSLLSIFSTGFWRYSLNRIMLISSQSRTTGKLMEVSGQEHLVDLIYDAVTDPGVWPQLLQSLAVALGGHSAARRSYDVFTEAGTVVSSRNLDADLLDRNFRAFSQHNPLKTRPEHLRAALPNPYVPGMKMDIEWLPKSDFMRTDYYNDFYRQLDIHADLSIGLSLEGTVWSGIDIYRAERQGPFGGADLALARLLHPHFSRASKMTSKLATSLRSANAMAALIDQSPRSLFLLDGRGGVRHANRAAESLLARGDVLTARGGRLAASEFRHAREFEAMIAIALTGGRAGRNSNSLRLDGAAGCAPLLISVSPARSDRSTSVDEGPGVVVSVSELRTDLNVEYKTLSMAFRLTGAEVRVAQHLSEGASPRQIADRLGVSVNTIRSQLSRVFHKTSTSNQAELSRLLARICDATTQ